MQRALDALEEERLARVEMTKAAFVKRRSLIEQDMERSRILRLRPSLPSLSAARRGAAKRFARQGSEAAPGGDEEPARYGWGGGGDGESATPARDAFEESPRRASDPGPRSGSPSYLDDDTDVLWVTPSSPHQRSRPRTTPLRKAVSCSNSVTDAPATHGGERKGRGLGRSSSWHNGNSAPPRRLLFGSQREEEGHFSLAHPVQCVPPTTPQRTQARSQSTLLPAYCAHESTRHLPAAECSPSCCASVTRDLRLVALRGPQSIHHHHARSRATVTAFPTVGRATITAAESPAAVAAAVAAMAKWALETLILP